MIWTLLYLFAAQYYSDFIQQQEVDANNKWHSVHHLTNHVIDYSLWMAFLSLVVFIPFSNPLYWLLFIVINGGSHFIIDYFTSKFSHYAFVTIKDIRGGFLVVGLDQLLHHLILITTWYALLI